MKTLVIAGGRDIELSVFALDHWLTLLGYYTIPPVELVVLQGEARGVDTSAALWCFHRGVPCVGVPADWERYGKGAGPVRNKIQADLGDELVAFMKDGSRGTADMVRQMQKSGKPTTVVAVEFFPDEGDGQYYEWEDL